MTSKPCLRWVVLLTLEVPVLACTGRMSRSERTLYRGWSPETRGTPTHALHYERRGARRVALDTCASFMCDANDSPAEARVVNLSTTGSFLVLNRLYGVGNILKVTIALPDNRSVSGTAIVRPRVRGRGNGVEFLMLAMEARRTIEAVTERPTGGYKASIYEHW